MRRELKWVRSLPMLMNPPHQDVALTKMCNSEVHCVTARGRSGGGFPLPGCIHEFFASVMWKMHPLLDQLSVECTKNICPEVLLFFCTAHTKTSPLPNWRFSCAFSHFWGAKKAWFSQQLSPPHLPRSHPQLIWKPDAQHPLDVLKKTLV